MKRFFKYLGWGASALIGVAAIAIILILRALPSPSDIGKHLKHKDAAPNVTSQPVAPPSEPTPAPPTESKKPEDSATATAPTAGAQEDKMMDDLLDEKQPLVSVCDHLKNASASPLDGYDQQTLNEKFEESALSENKDPVIQSFKPILRYIVRLPTFRQLIETANEEADKGDSDFTSKATFYKQLYGVYGEINAKKPQVDALADKTYYLYMMSRALAQRPDLASDPQITTYCHSLESAINTNAAFPPEQEKAEFQKFMDYAHVDGKDIGYDPNYKTDFKIEFDKSSLRLRGGWIESVLKNPEPESETEPDSTTE
jgi:hypothetical protein